MLDIYETSDLERETNKAALLLAYSRYQEQVGDFVNSTQRLAYAEPEIKRIVKECAAETGADLIYIEKHLRQIIADSFPAVDDMPKTKPQKQKLEFPQDGRPGELGYGGGPPTPPLKYDPAKVNPEPDDVTDTSYAQPPLLEDEIRDADQVHDLKEETFSGDNKNNFSHVVASDEEEAEEENEEAEEEVEEEEDGCDCENEDCACKASKYLASLSSDDLEELLDPVKLAAFTKEAPYGVPKSKGGDNEENDSKMERCVEKVMAEGHSKESAIKICKSSIFGDKNSCVRCAAEINKGIVCDTCEDSLLKKASPFLEPHISMDWTGVGMGGPGMGDPGMMGQTGIGTPMGNTTCSHCGGMMMNGSCLGCGYTENTNSIVPSSTMENQEAAKPDTILNNRMQNGQYPSFMGSVEKEALQDHLDYDPNPRPSAPIQGPQPEDRTDGMPGDDTNLYGPKSTFDDVVSSFANQAAAKRFSTPSDEDISAVAEQTGLNPDDVATNLKLIAKFGDITAVNGVVDADDDVGNYQEVQGLGGPVQDQEAEIPLQLAIAKVSEDSDLDEQMVMNELKDAFGNQDLPPQYHVPLTGGRKFYLPREMMAGSQPPTTQPSPEDQQEAPVPDIQSEYE